MFFMEDNVNKQVLPRPPVAIIVGLSIAIGMLVNTTAGMAYDPDNYDQLTPGPRNADAIVSLAKWLHPAAFRS